MRAKSIRFAAPPILIEEKSMDSRNAQFMFYGFTAAWLIVFIYVLLLALREARLRKELDRVRRMVEKK